MSDISISKHLLLVGSVYCRVDYVPTVYSEQSIYTLYMTEAGACINADNDALYMR